MTQVSIKEGELLWCGEHWINYLRETGGAESTGRVSLFHTRWSRAGEGNVAYVQVPGAGGLDAGGLDAVCTDNPELAGWLAELFVRGRKGPFDREMPVTPARFQREGDIRSSPAWHIETDGRKVRATWAALGPPVIAEGEFRAGHEHFTVLYFAERATIELDGRACSGGPYPVDTWQASIGGERSSCVFALAETFYRLP